MKKRSIEICDKFLKDLMHKSVLDNQNRTKHNLEEKEMKTKIYFHVKGSKVLSNLFFMFMC